VNEWPDGDEHPPYGSILGFSGFWTIFDRWKWCFNHKLIKRRLLIVKLQCCARELIENGYIGILRLADWGFDKLSVIIVVWHWNYC